MKRIRIVSYRGKTTLRWEYLDPDGELQNISLDSVDLVAKTPQEFLVLLDEIAEARKLPVISVNAANRSIYFKVDLE